MTMKRNSKRIQRFTLIGACLLLFVCGVVLTACKPVRPDYSEWAGLYYRVDDGTPNPDHWMELYADGTWTTRADHTNSGKYKVKDGEISIFIGVVEVMYGTIDDEKMTLSVWAILDWNHGVVFEKIPCGCVCVG